MEREPGFYWVKEDNLGWIVCEYLNDGWLIPGIDVDYSDNYVFSEIDEQMIKREEKGILFNDKKLTVEYLAQLHPELSPELVTDLLQFSKEKTITRIGCYGDGSIIYPQWKAQLPK